MAPRARARTRAATTSAPSARTTSTARTTSAPTARATSASASTPAPDDKREAVLSAALELFAERGFHGTAVPAIADQAGVGAGTIYRYFASKEAIVNALFQRWKGALGAAMVDELPWDQPARAQFEHIVVRVFAFARKHPTAVRFLENHQHLEYLDAESRRVAERMMQPALEFFTRNERARITRRMPAELLCGLVWGGILGAVRTAWDGGVELTTALQKQSVDSLWEAVRRPGD